MKALIQVSNIRSQSDVSKIRAALGNKEGIIACHIKEDNGQIEIVYDSYFTNEGEIYDLLEDMGYTVI